MTDFVYARGTENVHLPNGQTVLVPQGAMVPDTDPIVRLRPELFSTDPRYCASLFGTVVPDDMAAVETATANPGERRNARRS